MYKTLEILDSLNQKFFSYRQRCVRRGERLEKLHSDVYPYPPDVFPIFRNAFGEERRALIGKRHHSTAQLNMIRLSGVEREGQSLEISSQNIATLPLQRPFGVV